MKAIAFTRNLPASDDQALIDISLPTPEPGPRDLRVRVHAISVNPVDVKIRANRKPQDGQPEVIGWDAAGVVEATGAQVSLFKPGDRVWYAGALNRPGANSEWHLVDERLVGRMPQSLDFAQAAALPLTSITAWELLFERLRVLDNHRPSQDALLVVGAAGGVGSILVQLARQLTGLTIIATASRPETQAWARELGAHHVIDHRQPLAAQLAATGHEHVRYIAALTQTDQHFPELVKAIAPQGAMALIDDPAAIDVRQLKAKSASLHWEFMFARSLFETPDMAAQHELLTQVAALIDAGRLKTTLGEHYGRINAANLRRAHAFIESGRARGKIVLEGF
ncbi:zinc-binding alcohol dehydrogenase family protein [Bordetella hinzii]|uniref:Zinc-type alcohol dehydrogenase-like protein n=1 Tax=Bordetella hinzii TaxID=103855 RepID=A0AAN1RTB0_9BORD|nr:zinc-binding alcohol dehydrogenase family protein [Bordetella hinzii]AKQ59050.1 Zinc-type alcohol dehydrogenase-like protein [Bordetella hinzii]AZW15681.1 zinc-binding alcohol dehydrogenase family protein [Bordetella hinzii]KCB47404.1 zinc-binding alcohol dehydrogenase family protein [Bordetella hinzii 4161]KXA72943.1 NADPH:quinone reductase [Bordetella hinzii LMG 13501]MBZ0077412.1 zinc-binding alcohol dehydrogenase family protein [Bordetella hinzii]